MPNIVRLNRGTFHDTDCNSGNCQSSLFLLNCNEIAREELCEYSCKYRPGGLFVDTQCFSTLKLQPSSSSEKRAVLHAPLAPISLFLSLIGSQDGSSLCKDGNPSIQIHDGQSLAKGLFSLGKCGLMFCLGKRSAVSSNTSDKDFPGPSQTKKVEILM